MNETERKTKLMFDIHRVEIEWGGRKLTLETGRVARQADAAVVAQYGETSVLATVVSDKARMKQIIIPAKSSPDTTPGQPMA